METNTYLCKHIVHVGCLRAGGTGRHQERVGRFYIVWLKGQSGHRQGSAWNTVHKRTLRIRLSRAHNGIHAASTRHRAVTLVDNLLTFCSKRQLHKLFVAQSDAQLGRRDQSYERKTVALGVLGR